jgi:cytochrome c553
MKNHHWLAGIATGAAALLAAGVAGAIEVDPDSFQGRTEAAIAEFREAVQLEPNLGHGAELFGACASCHQADGSGSEDGTIPLIAGQHVSVLVKQLVDFRHDRRWHARMREAAKQHDLGGAQDILDVAAYTAGLKRPPPREGGVGDGKALHEGQVVYYRECAACHGRLGEGELRTLRPRLAGQHYLYLLKQLYDTASLTRPGMDEEHVKRISALTDAERAGVADYLSRLTPELTSVPKP